MNIEARSERTEFILSELGVSSENAECAVGYPKVTCTLTPEQIAVAEKLELITAIHTNKGL